MQSFAGEREAIPVSFLGESVSFGRFMSESLDWGRWSSFRHNRYLEEAEKYSRPGSVAQKKAFFEAHYKKMAARKKAEALVEQAINMEGGIYEGESNEESGDQSDALIMGFTREVDGNEGKEVEMPSPDKSNLDDERCDSEIEMEEERGLVVEDEVVAESPSMIQIPDTVEDIENRCKISAMEVNRASRTEKIPFKESYVANHVDGDSAEKKQRISRSKSPVHLRPSRCANSQVSKLSSPVKHVFSVGCAKENNVTLINKSATSSVERKGATSKSMHMSMNLSKHPKGDANPFSIKAPSILEKVRQFEGSSNSSKASRDCLHPRKTPIKAPCKSVAKLASSTTNTERLTTSPGQTPSGRRKVVAEVQTISSNCKRLIITEGTTADGQNASSLTSHRTNEKPIKRKESFLRLQEKLEPKDVKKVQLQGKATDKAESGFAKLRQSFCFKARPMPDFSTKLELHKNDVKKIPLTCPRSPKLRRSNSTNLLLPSAPTPTDGSKLSAERQGRTPSHRVLPQYKKHN